MAGRSGFGRRVPDNVPIPSPLVIPTRAASSKSVIAPAVRQLSAS
jgi:hypothetical protein